MSGRPKADSRPVLKPLVFLGSSRDDVLSMPREIRHDIGVELMRVQLGAQPRDFKPMPVVGSGVREIRIRDSSGAFRVMYVAKFDDAVYVLHAFQKKSQQTAKTDIDLARIRYKMIGTSP